MPASWSCGPRRTPSSNRKWPTPAAGWSGCGRGGVEDTLAAVRKGEPPLTRLSAAVLHLGHAALEGDVAHGWIGLGAVPFARCLDHVLPAGASEGGEHPVYRLTTARRPDRSPGEGASDDEQGDHTATWNRGADQAMSAPIRDQRHDALAVFLGRWRATGETYGTPAQSSDDPRGAAIPWVSSHTARWHTGEFFLIQDERATNAGDPFDTLAIMGVDQDTGRYFVRTIETTGSTATTT